jgi:DNA-directed RNA polymerase subunit N (RpoN/RPB10)
MLIPVLCVTCGKVLADKWEYYVRRVREEEGVDPRSDSGRGGAVLTPAPDLRPTARGLVLDELGLTRACCRRHFLGCVELVGAHMAR